jgi:hypothetical protein
LLKKKRKEEHGYIACLLLCCRREAKHRKDRETVASRGRNGWKKRNDTMNRETETLKGRHGHTGGIEKKKLISRKAESLDGPPGSEKGRMRDERSASGIEFPEFPPILNYNAPANRLGRSQSPSVQDNCRPIQSLNVFFFKLPGLTFD